MAREMYKLFKDYSNGLIDGKELFSSQSEVDELLRVEHGAKLLAQTDLVICKDKLAQLERSRRLDILRDEHFRVLDNLHNALKVEFETFDNVQYPAWMAIKIVDKVFSEFRGNIKSGSGDGSLASPYHICCFNELDADGFTLRCTTCHKTSKEESKITCLACGKLSKDFINTSICKSCADEWSKDDYPHDSRCEGTMCYCVERAKNEDPARWKAYRDRLSDNTFSTRSSGGVPISLGLKAAPVVDKVALYKLAYQKWGFEAQLGMLFEELGELITVLNKARRDINGCPIERVIDELADVEIMIEQYCYIGCIERNVIDARKVEKLERLKKLLEEK